MLKFLNVLNMDFVFEFSKFFAPYNKGKVVFKNMNIN